ncbi:VOC family protein [Flavobacterium sp. RHBU_24]|uniref:VOC family protein n=1 Tax=Flavobacterium sp. RHBU_24 TaxID=3391185 RepID=UPI003984CFB1
MKALNPYLNFNGKTEEVFTFYKSIFGGEFAMLMRFKDVPSDVQMDGCVDGEPDKDESNLIMHVALPIGNNVLMGSDVPGHMPAAVSGNSITLSINVESKEEADRVYAALAEGGDAMMPMDIMFWGDYFGMLKDKYDIQWMVNYSQGHQPPRE